MEIEKMRKEFELHYAEEFSIVRGYKPSPEEMVSMRDGDGYGSDRGYLNGYWKGWQASRESLAIRQFRGYKFEGCQYYDADAVDDALIDAGITYK